MLETIEAGLLHAGGRERARVILIAAGAVHTAATGAALLTLHRWALPLAVALVVHQALYIAFTHWRAHVRNDPDLRAEKSTVNAAVLSLGVLGMTIALAQADRLG